MAERQREGFTAIRQKTCQSSPAASSTPGHEGRRVTSELAAREPSNLSTVALCRWHSLQRHAGSRFWIPFLFLSAASPPLSHPADCYREAEQRKGSTVMPTKRFFFTLEESYSCFSRGQVGKPLPSTSFSQTPDSTCYKSER